MWSVITLYVSWQVRDIHHENVNAFLGICIDRPVKCFVTPFSTRGSLAVSIYRILTLAISLIL